MCGGIQSCSKGVPFDLETGNAEANRRFPNSQSGSSRPLGNKAGFLSDDGYKEVRSSAIFFSVAHACMVSPTSIAVVIPPLMQGLVRISNC